MLNPAEQSQNQGTLKRTQQAERAIADYQRLQASATPWQGLAMPNTALLCVWFLLMAIGVVMQVSTQLQEKELPRLMLNIGVYTFVALFLAAFLAYRTAMHNYHRWVPWFLLLSLVGSLLLFVPGVGVKVNGAYRWLDLKLFTLQVSEILKWVMVLFSAQYLAKRLSEIPQASWRNLFKLTVWYGVMVTLLYQQNDLGTAVILMAILWGMTFFAGAHLWRYSLALIVLSVVVAVVYISTQPYRILRVISHNDPHADRSGTGYQASTALEAHGLGGQAGFFGRGLGEGTYKYHTPEIENDFIYTSIGEELGMFGLLLVLLLFAWLVGIIMRIAWRAQQQRAFFEAFYCYGVAIWLFCQSWLHMAVNTVLVPPKGLTLPFISAGGSSLVVSCFAVAMVLRADSEVRGQMLRSAQLEALNEMATTEQTA